MNNEDLEEAYKNGMSFGEEQQLYWEKKDYIDEYKERISNIVKQYFEDINKEE